MSVADWLGLPEAFQAAVLILLVVLALAPYFPGVTLGSLQIPKLHPRRRRAFRVIGPVVLVLGAAMVLPISALHRPRGELRLLAADVDQNGSIDVVVENEGTAPALLTAVELEVVEDHGIAARPVLSRSAAYRLPIDDLAVGGRRRRILRHLVPAGAAERIVIAPQTGRALTVRGSLSASDGAVVTFTVELLPPSVRAGRR